MWRRLIASTAFVAMTVLGLAAAAADPAIGWVKTVSGDAYVVHDGGRSAAQLSQAVYQGDRLITGPSGSIGVTFTDNTVISAGPNSSLVLESYRYDPSEFKGSLLTSLLNGTMAVTTGDIPRTSPEAMRVRTPSAILGVRGTRFLVKAGEKAAGDGD